MRSHCAVALVAALFVSSGSAAWAQTLALDFQGEAHATAPGYVPFVATNQQLPDAAGTDYAAFGTTVNVSLSVANLPDGASDFRVVARNGTADVTTNDWIGVDTRVGEDVTIEVNVAGLPAGSYSWLSEHHDGAAVVAPTISTGNLNGASDYSFVDASGVETGLQPFSSERDFEPISTFARTFVSDGVNPVSLRLSMFQGQGLTPDDIDTGNHLFAFVNSVTITAIPEPRSLALAGIVLAGAAALRRRKESLADVILLRWG